MNFVEDEKILLSRFQDTFVPKYDKVPVDYVGQANSPLDHRMVKFRVVRANSRQVATMNGGKRPLRNYGSVLIVLTGPTNAGPGEVLEMADFVSKSFTGYRKGGLLCRPASLSGPVEKGALIEATVDVPFTSDYHA